MNHYLPKFGHNFIQLKIEAKQPNLPLPLLERRGNGGKTNVALNHEKKCRAFVVLVLHVTLNHGLVLHATPNH